MNAFMTPEIYEGEYAIIATKHGETTYCPKGYEDVADDETVEYATGYLGRLSASGYMDATDWTPLDATTAEDAEKELCEREDICHVCYAQCWDDHTSDCEAKTEAV